MELSLHPAFVSAAPQRFGAVMPPLVKVNRNALASMLDRQRLMAKPDAFFARYCGGRIPSPMEKLFCVEKAVQELTPAEVYTNGLYDVQVFHHQPFLHLAICRVDGQRCTDWQHFQQIKNEIVGPEYEAVELFPAQSQVVDTSNEYHLWVHASPRFRFPVNFEERRVITTAGRLLELARHLADSLDESPMAAHRVA